MGKERQLMYIKTLTNMDAVQMECSTLLWSSLLQLIPSVWSSSIYDLTKKWKIFPSLKQTLLPNALTSSSSKTNSA